MRITKQNYSDLYISEKLNSTGHSDTINADILEQYHLLLNNCAQVTLQVFAKSESAYKKELLAIAARHALPTTIFAEVKSIVTRYSLRYRKSGLRDLIQ